MGNNGSLQTAVNAIYKVFDSAPQLSFNIDYLYYLHNQSPRNDISKEEFNTWINYVNQILDITYNYIGQNCILYTKTLIYQIANTQNILYVERVNRIKSELLNLTREILKN